MKILKIAWRNIWRNKLRSLVVIIAMTIGIVSSIFIMAFSWGAYQSRITDAIEGEISHLQIHNDQFRENYEIKDVINNSNQIISQLDKNEAIKSYSPRLKVMAGIQSARVMSNTFLIGIDTSKEIATTAISKKLTAGKFLSGTKSIPIVLSEKLMADLKLGLKKKPVVQFMDANGDLVRLKFKIVGTYKTNSNLFDQMNAFVLDSDIRPHLKVGNNYHEIAILLHDSKQIETVKNELDVPKSTKIETWKEIMPEMAMAVDTFDQNMGIVIFIIMLAIAFGIINTMLMAILERVREIGMLMAIGMNKLKVFVMIMLETIMLGFAGVPLGLLGAFGLVSWLGKKGINLSAYSDGLSEFGFNPIIYPSLSTAYYFKMAGAVLIVAFLASIIPARQALKLKPVEAIRKL